MSEFDRTTHRRIAVIPAVLVLVITACTSGGSTTSTGVDEPSTTQAPTTVTGTTAVPAPPGLPTFPNDNDFVPVDGEVIIGTLANGLTYYIRENDRPGDRAQLRLAIKAGSLAEGPDQLGSAHFVEHMMFNGTESFPRNDLIQVLERFGAEFGPDINAYTTYEETVYSLELPTDDEAILETGFDVLAEWASKATIADDEVEAERGVLLEEWRLRSQSLFGRYSDAVAPYLFGGTRYGERPTLASPEVLDATTTEALQRFYREWYRPDLMAVVAVGDFSDDDVEALIIERFAGLENPPQTQPQPVVAMEAPAVAEAVTVADPESPQTIVELNYPLPAPRRDTIGGLRTQFAMDLAFAMVITRLSEDAQRGGTSFIDASGAANPWARPLETQGLGGLAEPSAVLQTLEDLLTEVKRAATHGFSQEEYDRIAEDVRGAVDQAYWGRGTTQDVEFAGSYVEHFLGGWPIPDAETRRDIDLALLDETTPAVIQDIFSTLLETTEPLVIILGPDDVELPTDEQLLEVVDRVATADVSPRTDIERTREALMPRPDPTEVIEVGEFDPYRDSRVLKLINGATVVIVNTDISRQVVAFGAASRGGWSLMRDEDVTEAQWATAIVSESGVGDLDRVELDRFLSGKVVSVFPYITESGEGLIGGAGTEDLETLFQLIHLYMTQPRADDAAWSQILASVRPVAEAPEQIPDLALFAELSDIRYQGHPDYRPYPTPADLDSLDVVRALDLYEERFGNARDFVFVFAGDLPPGQVNDLVARYLGTLPSAGPLEDWVADQPLPPAGVIEGTVEAGSGALGSYTRAYAVTSAIGSTTYIEASLLSSVLNQRLTDRIREELSATYSPFAAIDVTDEPRELIESFIQVSADPEGLEAIEAAVADEIADLRQDGPTADELAIAKEQYLRDLELTSNEQIVDDILFYLLRPDADPLDLTREAARVQAVTIDDLRRLVGVALPVDSYIALDLVPAG